MSVAAKNTNGLRQRKKLRTQELLAQAALALFLKHGYETTTVERIAEAAGVSPRTFFRYFETKEDVLFAGQALEDRVAAALLARRTRAETVAAALRRMVRALPLPRTPDRALRRRVQLILSTPALLARAGQIVGASVGRLARAAARSTSEERRARLLLGAYVGAYAAALTGVVESGAPLDLAGIADDVLETLRL